MSVCPEIERAVRSMMNHVCQESGVPTECFSAKLRRRARREVVVVTVASSLDLSIDFVSETPKTAVDAAIAYWRSKETP